MTVRQVVHLGMSERQVAKNLGVSRNTVAKWLKEDSDQAWEEMRSTGWIQDRPDATEREAIRHECLSPDCEQDAA